MQFVQKLWRNPLIINSLLSITARFTGVALNFLVAILITRQLTLGNAGVVFLLMTFVAGIALISRVGMDQLIVKEVASISEERMAFKTGYFNRTHLLVLLTSLLLCGLWLLLSPYLRGAFFDNDIELTQLMAAAACVVFFNFMLVNSFYLKAIRYSSTSVLTQNALPAVCFLLVMLLSWEFFSNGSGHVPVYIASLLLAGAASFLIIRPHVKQGLAKDHDVPGLKHLLLKSLPLAPISLFSFMMLWADTIMVAYFLNNEQVALYSVAAKISYISLFFLGALDATIYPRLLKIFSQQPEKLWAFFWQATGLVLFVIVAVTGMMYLLSDFMLATFRPEYLAAGPALLILLLAQLLRASSLTFSFMFIAREKVRYLNIALTTAMIINLIANVLLIPSYGMEGAAAATLLANGTLAGLVIVLFYQQKLLSKTPASEATL